MRGLALCWALTLTGAEAGTLMTGHLESKDKIEAAHELAEKLGYGRSGSCQALPMQFEEGHIARGAKAIKMLCPDSSLFIKYSTEFHDDAFASLGRVMEESLSPDLLASVLQPVAEFSSDFKEEAGPSSEPQTVYYTAFPWIEGVTLRELFQGMIQSGFDPERLEGLYRDIGSRIGAMHRAGLVDADRLVHRRETRLTHADLHYDNIMVTAGDEIVIIDPDAFKSVFRPQPALYWAGESFPFLLFVAGLEFDSAWSPTWQTLLPGMREALIGSYCDAFAGSEVKAHEGCVYYLQDSIRDALFWWTR